jgi:hypothetical protein
MFVQMLGWSKLDLLARCTADAAGLGLEGTVDSTYDDDTEETDERFVGVMISKSIGNASVVLRPGRGTGTAGCAKHGQCGDAENLVGVQA